jgi:hypothetical protein
MLLSLLEDLTEVCALGVFIAMVGCAAKVLGAM